MNWIYIGDRQLEPDEEPECDVCDSSGFTTDGAYCWNCQPDTDPGEPNAEFEGE